MLRRCPSLVMQRRGLPDEIVSLSRQRRSSDYSLGHRPRSSCKKNASAESAIHFFLPQFPSTDFETRFQRFIYSTIQSLGRCPRLI